MNIPKKIILHHSLTKDGEVKDYNSIKEYHVSYKGFKDIGYHYVIEQVYDKYIILKGRDEKTEGAHTIGENNSSIGICVVGNFDEDYLPVKHLSKVVELIRDIHNRYDNLPIYGHKDYPNPNNGYIKTCPGKNFPLEYIRNLFSDEDD